MLKNRTEILVLDTSLEFYENIDLDAIVVFEDIPWQDVSKDVKRDHFGLLRRFMEFDGPTWPFPVEPLINTEEEYERFFETFKSPDLHDLRRLATLHSAVERFKGRKVVIFGMHSSFIYPAFIRGINTDLRFLSNTLLTGHLGCFLFVLFLPAIAVNAMYTWCSGQLQRVLNA